MHGNGRRFSKRVENTLGKGEIALYEQFLPFQRCLQKPRIAYKGLMVYGDVTSSKNNDRAEESAEKDQNVLVYRLILM